MKYSTKDLCSMYGITRSRLHQMRKGYRRSSGERLNPLLVEGKEWEWDKGDIVFKAAAIRKLNKFYSVK